LLRILTDRGTEYGGSLQHQEYQRYLAIENIDHTRTKARSPQTNSICERLHHSMQDEFYQVAFRNTLSTTLEQLQADLDEWLVQYNRERSHSGKYCDGCIPLQTYRETKHLAFEKLSERQFEGKEPDNSHDVTDHTKIFAQ
jgi:hypothetical protein